MKDSYSFDIDANGLQVSYDDHRGAYQRIFDRLGLPYVIVKATSGAMGGSQSEEFLSPIDVGEDTFVRCSACNYAANTEAVTTGSLPANTDSHPSLQVVPTPNCPTIESLVVFLNENHPRDDRAWSAGDTLKNIVLSVRHPDDSRETVVIGIPGDRDIDIKRVEAQLSPAEVDVLDDAGFAKHPELVRGYIGPQVLGSDSPSGIRYLIDPSVVANSSWVTGANTKDAHVLHLVNGRDFTADGTIEAVEVHHGDPCPTCGAALQIARGIEIGHVFQLGTKYAQTLGLEVLDQNGKRVVVTMGSYGIGVSRAVAAIAEVFHDELGLKWPRVVAPADVHIVSTGKPNDDITAHAEQLAATLEQRGVEVVLDDRQGVSPGVKFKDAELLGIPTIVIVGKGLAQGEIEVRDRHAGTATNVPIDDVVEAVLATTRQ
jgi:prolyl-tRNA synthetase